MKKNLDFSSRVDRPILFSGRMVRAILDGKKTETRRVIKPQPHEGTVRCGGIFWVKASMDFELCVDVDDDRDEMVRKHCPHGIVGGHLWVRESWAVSRLYDDVAPRNIDPGAKVAYAADNPRGLRKRPGIYMPRWASRLTLKIAEIRVEPLHEIRCTGIRAEGLDCPEHDFASGFCTSECLALRKAFADLWDEINRRRGFAWADNPWVWVLRFEL
jgi:hypothetical protein